MAAITAEGVSKRYGETCALDGVSLAVDHGEVFALVGPNGAGKTTLVRALTGTTTPDTGQVGLLGESPAAVDNERLGLLPQSFTPPERLTARELLRYYAGLYEAPRPVDEVLADVGLADADGTRYADLSGGQQRRACVAITLVNDPDVLFLDEPTTGIDPAGRRAVWSLVESLADRGTTVFLTTHYMEEAERLADRVAFLHDGAVVETGSPAALVERHGGGARLRVETATTPPPTLDGIDYEVHPTDEGLVVPGVTPVAVGDVVEGLRAEGVECRSLSWTRPSLEDVYLSLADGAVGTDGAVRAERTGDDPVPVGGRP